MSLYSKIQLGVQNPQLLGRKISQKFNHLRYRKKYNPKGIDIFEKDWDTLIILDACRYDLFEQEWDFEGTLTCVTSRGSATAEWLLGNFDGRDVLDTVYVTGNPMLHRKRNEVDVTFHDEIDVWLGDAWDDELGTVPPGPMAEAAIKAHETYPNKRHLVHFVQPHYPFLGANTDFDKGHMDPDTDSGLTTWMQVATGKVEVSANQLWQLYAENLNLTMPHLRRLIDAIDGTIVITSDHGNMFGERSRPIPTPEWGHPPSIYTHELVDVPWFKIAGEGGCRNVIAEAPKTEKLETDISIQERLVDLGYLS